MLKIGLDFHGVIQKYPKQFAQLTKLLSRLSVEIHIITGNSYDKEIQKWLKKHHIYYDYFFSITDYHIKLGVDVQFDEKGRPFGIDEESWNKTKAQYCIMHNIDLHIDDSDVYGKYFKTPYLRMQ